MPAYFVPVENKLLMAIFTSSFKSPVRTKPVLTGTRLPQSAESPVPSRTRYLTMILDGMPDCGIAVFVAVDVAVGSSVGAGVEVGV